MFCETGFHKYSLSLDIAEYYGPGCNLVAGTNIAGFEKIADVMMAQGIL